jgi:Tfp pilus assembly protein PilF
MELLAGETLSSRLERGPLSEQEAFAILEQIAGALEAAHACGIIHRDLKPGNIMLVPEHEGCRAVILDFGIAQQLNPAETLRSVLSGEWWAGTPAYMAPEVLEGKNATAASDIHSLGVMMFEMVTGRLPFQAATPIAVAVRRISQDAPRARSYRRDLDRRWDHTISRCLERDPSKRPRTAAGITALIKQRAPWNWPKRILPAVALAVCMAVFVAVRPHSVNQDAQMHLDRALVAMKNQSKDGFVAAIRDLQAAINADPQWAPPQAELAYAYAAASNARFVDDSVALRGARTAALEAIRLDPRLARAQGALGWTESLDYDEWPKAEWSFRTALKLDPADPSVRYWFAVHLLKTVMFHEAENQLEKAMELTHREDANVWSEFAFLYWTSGQMSKLEQHMSEQLIAFPNFPATRYLRARLLKLEGKFDDAEQELSFSQALGLNSVTVLVERASLSAFRGDTERALEYLGQIEQIGRARQVDGLLVAGVYAKLGDRDRAFRWLEAAYERRDNTLLSLATSPVLGPLRSDPRFSDLLRRLHFTPQIMQQMEFSSSSSNGVSRQPNRTGT